MPQRASVCREEPQHRRRGGNKGRSIRVEQLRECSQVLSREVDHARPGDDGSYHGTEPLAMDQLRHAQAAIGGGEPSHVDVGAAGQDHGAVQPRHEFWSPRGAGGVENQRDVCWPRWLSRTWLARASAHPARRRQSGRMIPRVTQRSAPLHEQGQALRTLLHLRSRRARADVPGRAHILLPEPAKPAGSRSRPPSQRAGRRPTPDPLAAAGQSHPAARDPEHSMQRRGGRRPQRAGE